MAEARHWHEQAARVITAMATPDFPATLASALRTLVPFDYSVMFAYRGDAAPIDLYDDFPPTKRRVFVTLYQEGPYLLDPFFLACRRKVEAGLYRLRAFAPDRFYQGEYFRSYYVQTGLSEEIGYFVTLPGEVRTVISLMRAARNPAFSAREMKTLKAVEPIVRATAVRQWADLQSRFSGVSDNPEQEILQRCLDNAFHNFGRSVLTAREREVVEYVLKGYSSEAIGRILGIASGTVRIHRKNIYAKLGIGSQGELFSHFIRALAPPAPALARQAG